MNFYEHLLYLFLRVIRYCAVLKCDAVSFHSMSIIVRMSCSAWCVYRPRLNVLHTWSVISRPALYAPRRSFQGFVRPPHQVSAQNSHWGRIRPIPRSQSFESMTDMPHQWKTTCSVKWRIKTWVSKLPCLLHWWTGMTENRHAGSPMQETRQFANYLRQTRIFHNASIHKVICYWSAYRPTVAYSVLLPVLLLSGTHIWCRMQRWFGLLRHSQHFGTFATWCTKYNAKTATAQLRSNSVELIIFGDMLL